MKKIINPWEGLDGYMCFGCAPNNPLGLHMEFFEDGDDIVAFWKPQGTYQGWLRTLHGGIQTTLMDELEVADLRGDFTPRRQVYEEYLYGRAPADDTGTDDRPETERHLHRDRDL